MNAIANNIKKYKNLSFLTLSCLFFIFTLPESLSVTDSNLSNNALNKTVLVVETQVPTIQFVHYATDDQDVISGYDSLVDAQSEFILNVFPIRDDTPIFKRDHDDFIQINPEPSSSIETAIELLYDLARRSAIASTNTAKVIGIVSATTSNEYDIGAGYTIPSVTKQAAIVREKLTLNDYMEASAAHELGHTYGLCDEYSNSTFESQDRNRTMSNWGCPNGDKDDDGSLDLECTNTYENETLMGCPVPNQELIIEIFHENQNVSNLVNMYGSRKDLNFGVRRWVSNNTYTHLLNNLSGPAEIICTDEELIVISGGINSAFDITLDNFYIINGGCYANETSYGNPNAVKIEQRGIGGILLGYISRVIDFIIFFDGGEFVEANSTKFMFVMPYKNGTNFNFINESNNASLAQRNVTPNTPSVNITYPLGGEVIGSKFNITWNATDADGDNTYYAILISEDNGSNYTTLDLDLNKTYYELDPNDYNQSKDYVIKILATDGINTGNNVTNIFNFGTVSLNITSLQTLYSNGTYRIFEFIILNDGDTTVTDIWWQFDAGNGDVINSTINISSLNSGGSVFVYIEYNYSSSGNFNVKANATGLSESTTATASLGSSATVGDLLITSFDDLIVQGTIALFEIQAKNVREENITNINWTFDSDNDEVVNSTQEFNLQPNETIFIFIEYDYGTGGTFNPTATITNGIYSGTKSTSVTTNTAPVITAIPDVTFNEDSYNDTLNLSNYVSDAEDSVEDLTWNYESINILVSIDQNTKIVNISAPANWSGSESISFEVRDTSNLSDSDTVLVTVNPINDPPSFNSSNQVQNLTWPEDNVNISINLTKHFYDIDSSSLNFTASNTENISIYIENATGKVNITPNANWSGTAYAVFTAIDSEGLTATSNNITLNITPVNDVPTFTGSIPQWKWPEDVTNLSLNLTQYFSDIDGDSLKYNFTSVNNITISINNNTGIVNFTPDQNFNGIRYAIFTAIDALNITISSNNITLNVTPVNDPPTIDTYIPLNLKPSVVAGSNLIFNHTSSDIDGDSLSYSWKFDWVEQSTEQGWVYNSSINELGTHNVTLNVSDGTVNVSMQWNVTVINQTNINVYDFSVLHQNSTLIIFGFSVNNTGTFNLTNINWSLNTGPETITANELFGLKPNESIFVFVEYAYPTTGDYNAVASATDGTYSDSETITIDITDIEVNSLSVLNISGTVGIFEFIIENTLQTNLTNVSWIFDTKNSNVINSTITTTLQPNEEMFVYIDYNFTTTGTFNVNASARNGTLIDSRNLTVVIT